jgi:hypothetical protein
VRDDHPDVVAGKKMQLGGENRDFLLDLGKEVE